LILTVGISVPQEQAPVLAAQGVDPPVVVMTPGQVAPSAPRAPEVEAAPESAAGVILKFVCKKNIERSPHFMCHICIIKRAHI
jgi:hypothetical protein